MIKQMQAVKTNEIHEASKIRLDAKSRGELK